MNKAILSAVTVTAVLLSVFCAMQIPAGDGIGEVTDSGTAGRLSWTLEGNVLTVSGEGTMPSYSSATAPWSTYSDIVTDLVIEYGVTSIGNSAFKDMTTLRTVSLPDSLTLIDNSGFEGCSSLESIEIPDSVTSPGRSTFRNCTSLQSAIIGDGATYVGQYCFSGCSALESVTLGSSVASVGDYTFQNCTSLSEIVLPEGLTSIGQYCFQNCTALDSIDLPSTLLEMKGYSFSGSGLTGIVIPDSCTEVWRYSFYNCASLVSVVYPSNITYVGVSCFQNCTALETFVFGGSETEIRENAFNGCTSLNDAWLPESLQTVGNNAFKNCRSLTEAIFYENVTSIGNYAYQNCYALDSVTFGSNVSNIGTGCFNGCSIPEVRNASGLGLEAGAITYGSAARNCQEIETVEPYTASYTAEEAIFATQTVYASGEDVSFRVRPADPQRDGYAFDGWTDGSVTVSRYGTVTLPVSDLSLDATWASLVIALTADDQETISGNSVTYLLSVTGEGRMSLELTSCTGGTATLDGYEVTFVPSDTDSTVDGSVTVTITNGHATTELTTEVLVDPVFDFTNLPSDGSLAEEVIT